jgi:endo-alpha-1,4-polygalactosaminidase (GH114 family)
LIIEASVHGADARLGLREMLFSAEEVSVIRQGGKRPVFAYLNVGELAPYLPSISFW